MNGYYRHDNETHRASVSGRRGRTPGAATTAAAYLLIESENLPRLSELARNLISSSSFFERRVNFFLTPDYLPILKLIMTSAESRIMIQVWVLSVNKFYESLLFLLIGLTNINCDLLHCRV